MRRGGGSLNPLAPPLVHAAEVCGCVFSFPKSRMFLNEMARGAVHPNGPEKTNNVSTAKNLVLCSTFTPRLSPSLDASCQTAVIYVLAAAVSITDAERDIFPGHRPRGGGGGATSWNRFNGSCLRRSNLDQPVWTCSRLFLLLLPRHVLGTNWRRRYAATAEFS